MGQHGNCHQKSQAARQPVVSPFDGSPAVADLSLIVVNGDEQFPAWRNQPGGMVESLPHRRGMMQYPPGVHDLEGAQAAKVRAIQGRALFYTPIRVLGEVTPPQFLGASHRPWIVVEAMHRSEEHTSELQSLRHLVCRLLLDKKKNKKPKQKTQRLWFTATTQADRLYTR